MTRSNRDTIPSTRSNGPGLNPALTGCALHHVLPGHVDGAVQGGRAALALALALALAKRVQWHGQIPEGIAQLWA